MPYDRVERLTDLILVLLHAQRPLTLDEIAHEVPGYPAGLSARRQAFERDKRLLREEGVPVLTEAVEGPEQFGYRIDPGRYYLPDLHLDREEQRALHLAVAGVHLGDFSGRDALLKLGTTGIGQPAPLASLAAPAHLETLFEALRTQSKVTFDYRGTKRAVSPGGLWFRRGHWYLVGWDHGAQASRTFRVDRVDSPPAAGSPGGAELPPGFDPASGVPGEPWRVGEGDELTVRVEVDPIEAPGVVEEVGHAAVVHQEPSGAVTVELKATNFTALRSWLMGLLDHAQLVAPPEWRRQVVQWLQATAQAPVPEPRGPVAKSEDAVAAHHRAVPSPRTATPAGAPRRQGASPPLDTSQRFRRLLAMVGWLAQVGEAPIAELAARFGLRPDQVVRELELAACCGLPPYTPDALMEIVVTEDRVRATLPEDLARPRRLSAAEGLAIVAAARTILAIPGADQHGALARALAKLEAVLGEQRGLAVDLDEPPLLQEVRRGVESRRRLVISYHSASRDRTTERSVDPQRLSTIEGHWYLDATDRQSGEMRRFRVDRITSLRQTGEQADQAEDLAEYLGPAFVPGSDATPVRLLLSPAARWVLDAVPVEDVHPGPDGGVEVGLYVGGSAWLERLLLQLGPDGVLVDPPDLAHVGPSAARRVLARYGGAQDQSVGADP